VGRSSAPHGETFLLLPSGGLRFAVESGGQCRQQVQSRGGGRDRRHPQGDAGPPRKRGGASGGLRFAAESGGQCRQQGPSRCGGLRNIPEHINRHGYNLVFGKFDIFGGFYAGSAQSELNVYSGQFDFRIPKLFPVSLPIPIQSGGKS